jgi:hypothetical protein
MGKSRRLDDIGDSMINHVKGIIIDFFSEKLFVNIIK